MKFLLLILAVFLLVGCVVKQTPTGIEPRDLIFDFDPDLKKSCFDAVQPANTCLKHFRSINDYDITSDAVKFCGLAFVLCASRYDLIIEVQDLDKGR